MYAQHLSDKLEFVCFTWFSMSQSHEIMKMLACDMPDIFYLTFLSSGVISCIFFFIHESETFLLIRTTLPHYLAVVSSSLVPLRF